MMNAHGPVNLSLGNVSHEDAVNAACPQLRGRGKEGIQQQHLTNITFNLRMILTSRNIVNCMLWMQHDVLSNQRY